MDGVTPEMLQESGTEGEVSWSFDIKDMEYRNNVYVSAMLLKNPHLESSKAFLPSRALGVATIPVRDEKWSQKVTISTPEEVKANQTLKVSLDVNAGSSALKDAVAMISVVDEGLLSLTNHFSKSKRAFSKMPLNVQTFETIDGVQHHQLVTMFQQAVQMVHVVKVVKPVAFGQESSIFHKMERSMLILIFHNTVVKFASWL